MERKNLKIDESTKKRLFGFKQHDDTWDDTLHRLMDKADSQMEGGGGRHG